MKHLPCVRERAPPFTCLHPFWREDCCYPHFSIEGEEVGDVKKPVQIPTASYMSEVLTPYARQALCIYPGA